MESDNVIYETSNFELVRDKFIFPGLFICLPLAMGGFAINLAYKEDKLSTLIGFLIVLSIIVLFTFSIFLPQFIFYKKVTILEDGIRLKNKIIPWESVVSVTPHFTTCLKILFKNSHKTQCLMISNSNWSFDSFYKFPNTSDLFLKLKEKIKKNS